MTLPDSTPAASCVGFICILLAATSTLFTHASEVSTGAERTRLPQGFWQDVAPAQRARLRAQHERDAWEWFEKSIADPEAAGGMRRALPDFDAVDLQRVKAAMHTDAEMLKSSGTTADDLSMSIEHELTRKMFADVVALAPLPPSPEHARSTRSIEVDAAVRALCEDVLEEHAAVVEQYPTALAVDVLWAIHAVEVNQRVIDHSRVTAYALLTSVEYQVLRAQILDTAIDVIEACAAGDEHSPASCLCMREFGTTLCEGIHAACASNELDRPAGVCDALASTCRRGVDCPKA